jgi:hypothetical protein
MRMPPRIFSREAQNEAAPAEVTDLGRHEKRTDERAARAPRRSVRTHDSTFSHPDCTVGSGLAPDLPATLTEEGAARGLGAHR